MDFNSTVKGSLLEGFYPKGWDMKKIDRCCANKPADIVKPQPFWNKGFSPVPCADVKEFDVKMGHEIANEIRKAKEAGQKIAFILPVGPMGMYKWAVYFLKEWNVDCKHVWCFNMDEWADGKGNTLVGDASFQYAMEQALYNPLGKLTVPKDHRNFATKNNLPTYPEKIAALRAEGAKLPHRVLGADDRRGVQVGRRVEAPAVPHRRAAPSAHDRAERHHVVQEPHDARAVPREHDRPGADVPGRLRDRRRGRRALARHDVAGHEPLDDAPLRPDALRDVKLDPHAARPPLLPEGARRTARRRGQLVAAQCRLWYDIRTFPAMGPEVTKE